VVDFSAILAPSGSARALALGFGLVLALVIRPPLAHAAEDGERLVSAFHPDAAAWERVEVPDRAGSRLWKSRENEREQYRIEVLTGSTQEVREARSFLDGQGKASCKVFDTTTLREARSNGYPSVLWRTDCIREDGAGTTLLQLALRGRNALYLVVKSWPAPPSAAEVETWAERLERHLVCDPRAPGQGCPPGLERID
jgi:hypothetical protein